MFRTLWMPLWAWSITSASDGLVRWGKPQHHLLQQVGVACLKISLHFRSVRRQAARDRAEWAGTPSDG